MDSCLHEINPGKPDKPEGLYSSEMFENNKKISDFLTDKGVDVDYASGLSTEERTRYLIDILITQKSSAQVEYTGSTTNDDFLDQVGLIIIKPEIRPCTDEVIDFLNKRGHETRPMGVIYPTLDQWMLTYGYMLDKYPDVVYNYIIHGSLGLQPVLVQYSLDDLMCDDDTNTKDYSLEFDKKYCNKNGKGCMAGIRSEVCKPALEKLGFNDMSGYASSFDPIGYFRDTDFCLVFDAFNGVHIPSDRTEKIKNIRTFLL